MSHTLPTFSRNDILSAIGLQPQRPIVDLLLPALGVFAAGLAIGAGVTLLIAPKSGAQTRRVIGGGIDGVIERVASTFRGARPTAPPSESVEDDVDVTPRATPGRRVNETRKGAASGIEASLAGPNG